MKPYPDDWASMIRGICLSILLVRGGMQISFRGKGLIVLVLCTIPSAIEANVIAWIAYGLFHMPVAVCYAMAFTISCISPSILVPGCISINDKGYGRAKGICTSLIASGTFDIIICIILFSICSTIALRDA